MTTLRTLLLAPLAAAAFVASAADPPAFRAPADPPPPSAEAPPAVVEPAGPLTLAEAVELALLHGPEVAEASWAERASEARQAQAGKLPNPELDLRFWRLQTQGGLDDVESRRAILSQELELGGKRRRRVELARVESDMAGTDYDARRAEVAAAVAVEFAEVLGAQRRVEIARELVAFFEEAREKVEIFVERGSMRPVEVHQVTRRGGLARIDLRRAETDLAVARFALAATWGATAPSFTEAVGPLESPRELPALDEVLALAERAPAIAREEAALARGQAALALAKARGVPDVTVGVGLRWLPEIDERDWMIDLEIPLPLFDRKQGEVREARHDIARARSARRAALAAGAGEAARAYHALDEARSRSRVLADEVLPAARAALEAFRVAFETQAANLDDLLDARRDVARAEEEHARSLVEAHQALAALERTLGRSL